MLKLIESSGLFWTKINLPTIYNSSAFIKGRLKTKGLLSLTMFKLNFNKLVLSFSFFIQKNFKILFLDYQHRNYHIIKKFARNLNQFFLNDRNPVDIVTNFNLSWDRFKTLDHNITTYYKELLSYKKKTINLENNTLNQVLQQHKKTASLAQFIDSFFLISDNPTLAKQASSKNFITFSLLNIDSTTNDTFYFLFSNKNSNKMLISLLFMLESAIKERILIKNLK